MNSEKFIKVCTILIINFFRAHSDKLRLYGAGAAFFARSRSGPNLAGVSSGNSDFRSRLLNTEFYSYKIYGYRYQQYVLARHTTFFSHAFACWKLVICNVYFKKGNWRKNVLEWSGTSRSFQTLFSFHVLFIFIIFLYCLSFPEPDAVS